jgi:farnesyl-diphosphate farnesyltransferase
VEAAAIRLNDRAPAKAPGKATLPKAAPTGVETWSGKDRAAENFPVGSWLIARRLRPHIHAFYAFARNADDIADNPRLPPADRIARLGTMEDVLLGRRTAGSPASTALRASLATTGVTPDHARDLLHAFRQDTQKNRYATWPELVEYCRYSAMPVGRYVLDLHGESRDTWPHSDALCASLQILNHLQDCARDFVDLDRCYLPTDLMEQAGAIPADVLRPAETQALRQVFAALLEKCTELNRAAAPLPRIVRDRRLRLECAVITALARRLTRRLKTQDPIATRVSLTRTDAALSVIAALRHLP